MLVVQQPPLPQEKATLAPQSAQFSPVQEGALLVERPVRHPLSWLQHSAWLTWPIWLVSAAAVACR
jgi:hypothetical protein